RNGGEKSWDFQALLHTYFRVKDISTVEITGLESSPYLDKTSTPNSSGTSSSEPQKITSKIDQIFTPASSSDTPILIHHDGNKKFQIIRDNFNEVVVWNPWKEDAASLSDFEPCEGYKNMVCVEVGVINGWIELGPGETWEGSQIISVQ
ncbi:Bgt-334, partial [Blumeria graminis f. sp. tritici]